jgi:hypothetical protein
MVISQTSLPKFKVLEHPGEAQIALRVLTCWIDGQAPSLEDVKFLQSLKPTLKYLPVDELACIVMEQQHGQ